MAERSGNPSDVTGPAADDRRRGARRMIGAGLWVVGSSVVVALLPLVWGRWDINRYLVAFGLLGALLGTSLFLHGGWDWLRSRKR